MSDSVRRIGRRAFLGKSGRLTGGVALATTARSYASILGANDRISLGHIGIGNRGGGWSRSWGRSRPATTSR